MAWQRLDDDKRMVELIRYSISQKQNVGFRIQGEKTVFYSQIMEIDRYRTSSEREERLQLIIKRLLPDKGNALIPAYSDSRIEFLVKEYLCRYSVKHIGFLEHPAYFGHRVSPIVA